jgi:hypothetical protein
MPGISWMAMMGGTRISTLYNYVKALGGTVRIVASFPDGGVLINQFDP